MDGMYILTDDGEPVPCDNVLVWGIWMQSADQRLERRVAYDELPGDVKVSTVFLGLNHNFFDTGPPILFETMVFGGAYDQQQRRYRTRAEALAGHTQIVRELRGAAASITN